MTAFRSAAPLLFWLNRRFGVQARPTHVVILGWVAFTLFTAFAWAWNINHTRQDEGARVAALAQQITRLTVGQLSLIFNQIDLLHLELLSLEPDLLRASPIHRAQASANLQRMFNSAPHILRNLGLVDQNGDLLVEGATDPPRPANIADREYFQYALARPDRMIVSKPLLGRLSGERSLVAASGRLNGAGGDVVAVAALDLNGYGGVVAALGLPSSWAFALWRDDGVLLYRLPAADQLLGKRLLSDPQDLAERMDPRGRTLQVTSPVDGAQRLIVAQKLPNHPLNVVIAVEQDWIDAQADARRRSADIAFGALLLLGALFFAALVELQRRSDLLIEASHREIAAARREDAARAAFLSNISHHLRTPLHAMVGFLDLLALRRPVPPAPPEEDQGLYLDHARAAGGRMTYVIDRLIDFATIDGADGRAARACFDPTPLLRVAAAAAPIDPDRQSLDLSLSPDAGLILGDPAFMGRMLEPLLTNAAQYAHSRVGLELKRAEHGHVLRLWDDGPGFPEDWTAQGPLTLAAVYDHEGGMGMGLPIVRRLAEAMGWRVQLGRAPEGGAEIAIIIPAST